MQVPAGKRAEGGAGQDQLPGEGGCFRADFSKGVTHGQIKPHHAELPGKIAAIRAGAGQQAVDYRNLLAAALCQEALCVAQGGFSLDESIRQTHAQCRAGWPFCRSRAPGWW